MRTRSSVVQSDRIAIPTQPNTSNGAGRRLTPPLTHPCCVAVPVATAQCGDVPAAKVRGAHNRDANSRCSARDDQGCVAAAASSSSECNHSLHHLPGDSTHAAAGPSEIGVATAAGLSSTGTLALRSGHRLPGLRGDAYTGPTTQPLITAPAVAGAVADADTSTTCTPKRPDTPPRSKHGLLIVPVHARVLARIRARADDGEGHEPKRHKAKPNLPTEACKPVTCTGMIAQEGEAEPPVQ